MFPALSATPISPFMSLSALKASISPTSGGRI
jgi:hypothetical protein